jgi:hypothetical protein
MPSKETFGTGRRSGSEAARSPEGLRFAIGTAYGSDTEGLALFVIPAIAIQNIPEGTSVAIPMDDAGALSIAPVLGCGREEHRNRSAPFSPIR